MSGTTMVRGTPTRRRVRSLLLLGAAAVLPLITSTAWYVVFGDAYSTLRVDRGIDPPTEPAMWQMVGQLVRNGVVVAAMAVLVRRLRITDPGGAVRLGLLLWGGFQAMAVLGSVLHEQYPLSLYLIHVGDALQATLVMVSLVALAGRRPAA